MKGIKGNALCECCREAACAIWGFWAPFFYNSKIECRNVNEPLKCQPNICSEWNTHGDRATQDVNILCNITKVMTFRQKVSSVNQQHIGHTSTMKWNVQPTSTPFEINFQRWVPHCFALKQFSVIWYDHHTCWQWNYTFFFLTKRRHFVCRLPLQVLWSRLIETILVV